MTGPRGHRPGGCGGGMGHYPPPMNDGMPGRFHHSGGCCGCAIPAMALAMGGIAGILVMLL